MKVLMNNHLYEMTDKQAVKFREQIKTQVNKCIFAVKKGDMLEMRNDKYKSKKQLFDDVAKWNKKGFIAYWVW